MSLGLRIGHLSAAKPFSMRAFFYSGLINLPAFLLLMWYWSRVLGFGSKLIIRSEFFMLTGSTGEPDRKRRHFSSISPTAAAKKQPAFAPSEDKKVWSLCSSYFIFSLAYLVQFIDSSIDTSLGLEWVKCLIGEFVMLLETRCDIKSSNLVVSGDFWLIC